MEINPNYQFLISISKSSYKNKAETIASIAQKEDGRKLRELCGMKEKVSFQQVKTTPSGLLERILGGYTFCHLFSGFPANSEQCTYVRQDGFFTLSGKSDKFFQGSYIIGIDIDSTSYVSPRDYTERLSVKPTFWYTSLSNMQTDLETGESKGCRFRLIYVFDELISDKYFFRYCSWCLHKRIEEDVEEKIKDKCGIECSQYFNGTNRNDSTLSVDYELTNNIYSLPDINTSEEGYLHFLQEGCYYKTLNDSKEKDIEERIRLLFSHSNIIQQQHTQLISTWDESKQQLGIVCRINTALFNDAQRLPYDEFYNYYKHQYQYVYRVERNEWKTLGEIKYQWCDDSYLELPWIPNVITDGHHRRNTLFHRAWLRRLIKPDITPDEMFFNLLVDCQRFFDNSDGALNVDLLSNKVYDSFKFDISSLIEKYSNVYKSTKESSQKKKVIIHRDSRGKISANGLVKELQWQILDTVYNKDMTVEENLHILNDSDIDISQSTLYRYLFDRGIVPLKTSDKKFQLYKSLHKGGMSIREEIKYLKDNGLSLSTKTVAQYRKKLEVVSKELHEQPKLSYILRPIRFTNVRM